MAADFRQFSNQDKLYIIKYGDWLTESKLNGDR